MRHGSSDPGRPGTARPWRARWSGGRRGRATERKPGGRRRRGPCVHARANMHRRPALLAAAIALLSLGGAARAESNDLLAGADPSVSAALLADGGADARAALDAIVRHGAIDRALIERALAMPLFAPHARATLIALAVVDTVPGA